MFMKSLSISLAILAIYIGYEWNRIPVRPNLEHQFKYKLLMFFAKQFNRFVIITINFIYYYLLLITNWIILQQQQ